MKLKCLYNKYATVYFREKNKGMGQRMQWKTGKNQRAALKSTDQKPCLDAAP